MRLFLPLFAALGIVARLDEVVQFLGNYLMKIQCLLRGGQQVGGPLPLLLKRGNAAGFEQGGIELQAHGPGFGAAAFEILSGEFGENDIVGVGWDLE